MLLGAGSIDEALTGVDALHRLADADHRIVGQTRTARRLLAAARLELAATRRNAEAERHSLAVAVDALERERAGKLALLRGVRDEQQRLAGQIDQLDRLAAEAAARSQARRPRLPRRWRPRPLRRAPRP